MEETIATAVPATRPKNPNIDWPLVIVIPKMTDVSNGFTTEDYALPIAMIIIAQTSLCRKVSSKPRRYEW